MQRYKIRPHHGLCLQFFEGKGYSKEFVENMYLVQEASRKNAPIELRFGKDTVCEKCPNFQGEACLTQEKVEEMDRKVTELCNLYEGQQMGFSEYLNLVQDNILKGNQLEYVCSTCSWYTICATKNASWSR